MSAPEAPLIGDRWRPLDLLSQSEHARVLLVEDTLEEGPARVLKIARRHSLLNAWGVPWTLTAKALWGGGAPRCVVEHEAAVLGSLPPHPALPALLEVGRWGHLAYLVVERREGHRLDALEGPLPPAQQESLLRGLLGALGHLHEHGVIHRDLHPGNLLFSPASGEVSLLDLGLATLRGAGLPGYVGKRAYRAPEWVAYAESPWAVVDHRADLYALGVTLYRVFSGRLPQVLGEVAAPEGVEEEVGAWILSLLEPSPGARPVSARDALERLEAIWRRDWEGLEALEPGSARAQRFAALLGAPPTSLPYVWHHLRDSGALDEAPLPALEPEPLQHLALAAQRLAQGGEQERVTLALTLGNLPMALEAAARGCQALEGHPEPERLDQARARLGWLQARCGLFQEAWGTCALAQEGSLEPSPDMCGLLAWLALERGEDEQARSWVARALEEAQGLSPRGAARLARTCTHLGALPEALQAALVAREASRGLRWSPPRVPRVEAAPQEALSWLLGQMMAALSLEDLTPESLRWFQGAALQEGLNRWVETGCGPCDQADAAWPLLQFSREMGLALSLVQPEGIDPLTHAHVAAASWILGEEGGDAFCSLAVAAGLLEPARFGERFGEQVPWPAQGAEPLSRGQVISLLLLASGQPGLARRFVSLQLEEDQQPAQARAWMEALARQLAPAV